MTGFSTARLLVASATLATTILLGCGSDPTAPLPAWPEDGRMPALGRYEYEVSVPAKGSLAATTYRGEVRISSAAPMTLGLELSAPGIYFTTDGTLISWRDDHYQIFFRGEAVPFNIVNRVWRPDGAERLECEATYATLESMEYVDAECSLRLVGAL